jgi:hypothetical protein
MHKNTKLTPVLRREIYAKWVRGREDVSLRILAAEYHVDKRVIGRIIERGSRGDFDVHDSSNLRYQKSAVAKKSRRISKRP